MSTDELKRTGEKKDRRPYVKPALSEVPLRMEEAVLGNCKTDSSAGPLSPTGTCTTTGLGGCKSLGS